MGVVEVLDPVRPTKAGGWKVDVSRGERNGRVSSEWFNRPDDERYLSLDDLWANVKGRSERSRSRVVQTADIRVAFKPDWTKHAKAAPFKRNDAMLDVLPVGVLVFPGNGIQENLADKAKKLGIPVMKFEKGA